MSKKHENDNKDIVLTNRQPLTDRSAKLFEAAAKGSIKIVEFLVTKGVDVNKTDAEGNTALSYAAKAGKWDIVRFLVVNKANVNKTDAEGNTALSYAAKSGEWDIVKFLVQWDIVNFLAGNGIVNKTDSQGNTALSYAAKAGKWDIVKFLLENGADLNSIDDKGNTALPYNFDDIALAEAATKGNLELVKFLIRCNAVVNKPDTKANTALSYAAKAGKSDIVKFLLEKGADPNNIDDKGNTALSYASPRGDLGLIKSLIESKADVNIKDHYNSQDLSYNFANTALAEAISKEDSELVKFLVHSKADVNKPDAKGNTALFNVASKQNQEMARFLLDSGANYDGTYKSFFTEDQNFYKVIFTNISEQPGSLELYSYTEAAKIKSKIFNNHINIRLPKTGTAQIGKSISLDEQTPIKYSFYLPKNEVKSVLVVVYGGGKEINGLIGIERFLINNGIAIATLNLVDVKELQVPQLEMPKPLYERVQASIHKFYDIIRSDPAFLHDQLKCLNNKQIFLSGGSFGGLVTERHAELFPDTFDGYISISGTLSYEAAVNSDLVTARLTNTEAGKAATYLFPRNNENSDDKAKHLIIHNLDDNNVNFKEATAYYYQAKKAGKTVQVFFNNQGNLLFSPEDKINKGHLSPDTRNRFEKMSKEILKFITESPLKSSAISDWLTYKYDIYANQNYRFATQVEKFISAAYRLHDKLKNDPSDEQTWNNYYKPLYDSLAYIGKSKDNAQLIGMEIKMVSNLPDEFIQNAAKRAFQDCIEADLIQENSFLIAPTSPPRIITKETMIDDKWLIESYKKQLTETTNPKLQSYLLKTLYMANIGKLNHTEFENFKNSELVINGSKMARKEFCATLAKEKELLQQIPEDFFSTYYNDNPPVDVITSVLD